MGFINWLTERMGLNRNEKKQLLDGYTESEKGVLQTLTATELAIHICCNRIAAALSLCEFRTYRNHEEIQELEWYTLNYEPNRNQNGNQWLSEIVYRLLYFNECLVFEYRGELVISDVISKTRHGVHEWTFSQVGRDDFSIKKDLRMNKVLYFRLNNKNISGLISGVVQGYARLIGSAERRFVRDNGERGILQIATSAQNDADFEDKYKHLMNEYFKTYFDAENAVLPLYEGYEYQKKTDGSAGGDSEQIVKLDAELTKKVCAAFGVPVGLVTGESTKPQEARASMITDVINPIGDMIATELTRKRYNREEVIAGSYTMLDTTMSNYTSLLDCADELYKLYSIGFSQDEIRRVTNQPLLNTAESRAHTVTKNNTTITQEGEDE